MDKAEAYLEKHYTRLKPTHRIKKNGRKPVLSVFYLLYPKSQNGMGKVTIYYNGGGKIEFMENNEIKSEDITFLYNIQKGITSFTVKSNTYESPLWYRRISMFGKSALTKKLGGRKSRRR